jgi:hypothetical protein
MAHSPKTLTAGSKRIPLSSVCPITDISIKPLWLKHLASDAGGSPGTNQRRSAKSERVSHAVRRLLQDVLSHHRFEGFRFGTIRESRASFIKDRSEQNQGFGIIMGHRGTSRSPLQTLTPGLSAKFPT